MGERVFQNRGVCGQAVSSFPSPTPFLSPFCSCPIFRSSRMQKTNTRDQNFVRFVRERLLRRLLNWACLKHESNTKQIKNQWLSVIRRFLLWARVRSIQLPKKRTRDRRLKPNVAWLAPFPTLGTRSIARFSFES